MRLLPGQYLAHDLDIPCLATERAGLVRGFGCATNSGRQPCRSTHQLLTPEELSLGSYDRIVK